jgi:hypothetical protein
MLVTERTRASDQLFETQLQTEEGLTKDRAMLVD